MSLYDDSVARFKCKLLTDTLERFDGHQQKASAYLGMHRNTMMRLIASCGVDYEGIRAKARRRKKRCRVRPRKRILLYYPNAETASELAFKLNLMMQVTVTAVHLEREVMRKLPDGWDGVVLFAPSEGLEKVVADLRLPVLVKHSLVVDMAIFKEGIRVLLIRKRGPQVERPRSQRLEIA